METALLNLLIVEDSQAERMLMEAAMKEAGLTPLVHCAFAHDGEEAMDLLLKSTTPSFDLILLDLNLPKVSGREVLVRIKAFERFSSTRVVIMSNSSLEEDIEDCHRKGADGYIEKPDDYEHLVELCHAIRQSIKANGAHVPLPLLDYPKH